MGSRFFIDETKAKSYLLVAVECPDEATRLVRQRLGRLVLPGQRSLHMRQESARRRRQVADTVAGFSEVGVTALVVDAGRGPEPEHQRRSRALQAVVERAAARHGSSLVVDLDQTLVANDRRTIATAARLSGADELSYSHLPLASELMLALPDAIAWCWARGADWRRRIRPVVAEVVEV